MTLFCILLIFVHYLSPYQQTGHKGLLQLTVIFILQASDTLVFSKKDNKIFTTYLIIYLACNEVVLIVTASEPDVLEPASYIWFTGIYAELHIAKLI